MSALELIARLKERGIRIAARDGELELDAPRGALDAELRNELVARKPELLRLLSWSRRSARDVPLLPADRVQRLPLSWAQQRLWFLDALEPQLPWLVTEFFSQAADQHVDRTVIYIGFDSPQPLDQAISRHHPASTFHQTLEQLELHCR